MKANWSDRKWIAERMAAEICFDTDWKAYRFLILDNGGTQKDIVEFEKRARESFENKWSCPNGCMAVMDEQAQ